MSIYRDSAFLYFRALISQRGTLNKLLHVLGGNTTHEHMTASWRPKGQTQSHMNFSYLHIINHSVPQLHLLCAAQVLLVIELLPKCSYISQDASRGRAQSLVSSLLSAE